MINETASSTEDRPALRSSVRVPPSGGDSALHNTDLRDAVASVLMIEQETHDPEPEQIARDTIFVMNPQSQLVASYTGRLLIESEAAYDRLDALLKPMNYLPVFRWAADRHVVHILSARVTPKPRPWWINVVLLALTIFAVLEVGTRMAINEIAAIDLETAEQLFENYYLELWRGLPYAISILLILGGHELGHYFAARHHRIAVTLPYFIPAPFVSFLGTFGAFIQLREPMRNRKVLLDIGAAGPLAGLLFAVPILFIGLKTSEVNPITPGLLEGNSILYALMKILAFGRFLPDGQSDVYINQFAMAGWAGLLVTALNLIPLGQLDGGHVLYSLIGNRARLLFFPLIAAAAVLAFFNDTWILWVVLLVIFGRTYAAPLDMITPLDNRRRWIGVVTLLLFLVTFVPVPLTLVEPVGAPPIRDSVFALPMLTAAGIVLLQRLRR